MKKLLMNLIALGMIGGSMTSCTTGVYLGPDYYYNCYAVYDAWGYYLYDDCFWEYYSNGEKVSSELDMAAVVGDMEQVKLEKMAGHYSEKFGMSTDQALKIAKNVQDISALEDRTEADVADFAERMYGINPSEIVTAVSAAQVGNNEALDALVNQAATNFEISPENTRELIKELHGSTLNSAGISL